MGSFSIEAGSTLRNVLALKFDGRRICRVALKDGVCRSPKESGRYRTYFCYLVFVIIELFFVLILFFVLFFIFLAFFSIRFVFNEFIPQITLLCCQPA